MGQLLVIFGGLITTLFTVVGVGILNTNVEGTLHGFGLWFVPVGTLVIGLICGSGYWIAGRVAHVRPQVPLLCAVAFIGVAAYLGLEYLDYRSSAIKGAPVSASMTFGEFWKLKANSSELQIQIKPRHGAGTGGSITLGPKGYAALAAIDAFGLMVGSLVGAAALLFLRHCNKCHRFFASKGSLCRYGALGYATPLWTKLVLLLRDRQLSEVMQVLAEEGGDEIEDPSQHNMRIDLALSECDCCGDYFVELSVNARKKNGWSRVDVFGVEGEKEGTASGKVIDTRIFEGVSNSPETAPSTGEGEQLTTNFQTW